MLPETTTPSDWTWHDESASLDVNCRVSPSKATGRDATQIGERPVPRAEPRNASPFERALWLIFVAAGVCVLCVAASIEPNPSGFGTHTQLGLPPCGFLTLTGFPCPGCGLTTAFAHGVRGHFGPAFSANPLGLVLFLALGASIVVSLVAAVRGFTPASVFDRLLVDRLALAVAGCAVLVWVTRFVAAI